MDENSLFAGSESLMPAKNLPTILSHLKRVESEYNITLLYAVESGSRAYGFHSENSDFDVRGIYRQNLLAYLDLGEVREQVDLQAGDTDLVLWDVRKAIRLITVSNPSILDWLSSKIIYYRRLQDELAVLAKQYYNAGRYFQANYGLAKSHFRKYVDGKSEIELKVYLYTIRSLAACRYVLREPIAPPVGFKFFEEYPAHSGLIKELIKAKKENQESSTSSLLLTNQPTVDTGLSMLIEKELGELDQYRNNFPRLTVGLEAANECFHRLLFGWQ
jgi:uncharacterized protein